MNVRPEYFKLLSTAFRGKMQDVLSQTQRGRATIPRVFSKDLYEYMDRFSACGESEAFVRDSVGYAEELYKLEEFNLSAIVCSVLSKLKTKSPVLRKVVASLGFKNAVKLNDPVHAMARAYDLSRVYQETEYGCFRHIRALCDTEKYLKEIIENYSCLTITHRTITQEMKPIEHYKFMLGMIKLRHAEAIYENDMAGALKYLHEAEKILKEFGGGTISDDIQRLKDEIITNPFL